MRPPVPVLLAVLLLAAGCGEERAAESAASGGAGRASSSASPTPAGTLDGFPLALGYDDENGDDHSPVRVTDQPAAKAFELCGVLAWDPDLGSTDVLGVEWRGEAEWARGRTLVLYPSVEDASAAIARTRDAVTHCPDEPAEPEYGTKHTPLDVDLGDESVAWADTYWFTSDGDKLHDTGLTVHHLVRVGRAVLLAHEYGEGNGSEESRRDAIARATALERPVVAQLWAHRLT